MAAFQEQFAKGMAYQNEYSSLLREVQGKNLDLDDILLPPSIISAGGLALVEFGITRIETLTGAHAVAVGRGLDLLDGFVARSLDMATPTGGVVDTICDKIAMTSLLAACWKKDIMPKYMIGTIAGSNLINAAASGIHFMSKGHALSAIPDGKHAMASFGAATIAYVYANAYENDRPDRRIHDTLRTIGTLAFAAGTVFAGHAATQYIQQRH